MLQSIAAPITGQRSAEMPVWQKAACRKRAAVEAPSLLGWMGAAAVTALAVVGLVALLVAEYAAVWAVLVAPWLDSLPTVLPWAF